MYGVILVALIFSLVASVIAKSKGRNSLGWFIAGLLIGPFALVVMTLRPVIREGQFKRCPVCAEIVGEPAKRCHHCGWWFKPEKEVENGIIENETIEDGTVEDGI